MEQVFTGTSRSGHFAPMPVACCFDFDGLLVDTAGHWAEAYVQACTASGGTVEKIEHADLHGASVPAAARILSHQVGAHVDAAVLHEALEQAFRVSPPPVLSGVRAVLEALRGLTRMVVVTNGPGALVTETLTRVELLCHFAGVVSADEVTDPKPAPDVYLAACRQVDVSPSAAVAFEDSPLGLRAARSAGLRTVAVPDRTPVHDADLVVQRIDDPRVFTYLGLEPDTTGSRPRRR